MIDGAILRAGLKVLAHALNRIAAEPQSWQKMTERAHLELALKAGDRALVNALGGDHLAEAAAHMLLALQCREFEREHREAIRAPRPKLGSRLIARYGAG
jgi:hypothetical protein